MNARGIGYTIMLMQARSLLIMDSPYNVSHSNPQLDPGIHRAPNGEGCENALAPFRRSKSLGLEGLVVKKPDSLYVAGARNFNWVKLKRHSAGALQNTIDRVLLGYLIGRGKRAAFGVGALLVGVYVKPGDLFVTVSKISTGLSDEGRQSIRQRTKGLVVDHKPARVVSLIEPSVWVELAIVIEVLADEITCSPMHTAGKEQSRDMHCAFHDWFPFARTIRSRRMRRRWKS